MQDSSPPFVVSTIERRWLLLASGFICVLTALPFALCALSAADADAVFSGFLLNPADGFTYLAKMRMGLQGHWLYRSPFTLEPSSGALLFTFYVALGHLASLFDLPLVVVFHIARLAATFMLLWVLYNFIARYSDAIAVRRRMWLIVALSSGLGWVSQKYGLGYSYYEQQAILHMNTFYVMLIAPHLPLATAIMLLMLSRVLDAGKPSIWSSLQMGALSLSLALILPFMVPLVFLVLGVTLCALGWRDRAFPRRQALLLFCCASVTLPLLLYMQLGTEADPTLRAFSMQNATLTPPPLAMLLAFGLLLPFLLFGIHMACRRHTDLDLLLLAWIAVALILMYLPYRYQWRFSAGLHVPIAMLAALGLDACVRANWARRAVMAAMALTPFYLMLTLISSKVSVEVAAKHYPLTYLSRHEAAALAWLQAHVPADAAVLASREMGMFIPAFSGQRVIYGHVSETIAPEMKSRLLDDFFSGKKSRVDLLRALTIDYVLLGPRERARGNVDVASLPLALMFSSGDVQVYKVSF